MEHIKEYLPLILIAIFGVYLWWVNKDRHRANTYQDETQQAREYRVKSYEHMEKVEKSLERIAAALERKSS